MGDSGLSRDDKDFLIRLLEEKFARVAELIDDVKDIKITVQRHEQSLYGVAGNNGLTDTVKKNTQKIIDIEAGTRDLITESTFNDFQEKRFIPIEKWKDNVSGVWGILTAVMIGVFIFITNYIVGRLFK